MYLNKEIAHLLKHSYESTSHTLKQEARHPCAWLSITQYNSKYSLKHS